MELDYRRLSWQFSSKSSGGQYLKSEILQSGRKYYLKLSDYGYDGFRSHEAVLEVIASRLGEFLGFPVLKYTGSLAKVVVDGKEYTTYVTKCLNYCRAQETAIPLLMDFEINKLDNETPLEYCRRIGLTELLDKIFIFDYLIQNVDRHGNNIELLYSGSDMRPAPVFDNGRCLTFACGNKIENILNWDYISSGMGNNFIGGVYLENNLRHVSKTYTVPELTKEAFRKIFYGLSNVLDKRHLQILEKGIMYRYEILLDKGVIKCGNI